MKHWKRISLEIIFLVIFIGILIHLLQEHAPKILTLLESGNAEKIDDYLMEYGTEGKYLLVLLQVIETISIVLPAVPVYICSGIMFGKITGICVCYGVNLILNLMIFIAAKNLKSSNPRFDISKQKFIGSMIEKAKHMDRVVIVMCLLPIVPNGMIPYLSAQTKITTGQFIKALALGSFPSVAIYVCCGDFLMTESYKIIAPVIIVLVVISVIAIIFRKKLISTLEPKLISFIEG